MANDLDPGAPADQAFTDDLIDNEPEEDCRYRVCHTSRKRIRKRGIVPEAKSQLIGEKDDRSADQSEPYEAQLFWHPVRGDRPLLHRCFLRLLAPSRNQPR